MRIAKGSWLFGSADTSGDASGGSGVPAELPEVCDGEKVPEADGDKAGETGALVDKPGSVSPATNINGTCWARNSLGYEFIMLLTTPNKRRLSLTGYR